MENLDKIAEMTFHGIEYIIKITTKDDILYIEIEQKDNGDIWKNAFNANYIEEITQKTGNFKKFSVFVKMLLSSISKSSDSVFLDILTYHDLEMLKARRQKSNPTPPTNLDKTKSNKRYMILTYSVEYDKVHYPLPLNFEETPDVEALRNTIRRLRFEVEDLKKPRDTTQASSGFFMTQDGGGSENRAEVISLKAENEALREKIKKLEEAGLSNPQVKKMGAVEYDQLLKSKNELENNFENLKRDYVTDIKRMKAKLEETEAQLQRTKEELDKAKSFSSEPNDGEFATRRIRGADNDDDHGSSIANKLASKYQREMERLSKENESLKNANSKLNSRAEQLEMELELALQRVSHARVSNKNGASPHIRSRDISPSNSATKKSSSISYQAFDKKITPSNSKAIKSKFSPNTSVKGTPTKNLMGSGSKLHQYGERLRQGSLDNSSSKVSGISRALNQKASPLRLNQNDLITINKRSPQQNRYLSPTNKFSNNSPLNKASLVRRHPTDKFPKREFINPLRDRPRNAFNPIDFGYELTNSKKNISLKGSRTGSLTIEINRSIKGHSNSHPNIKQQLKENIQDFKESQNSKISNDRTKDQFESSIEISDIGDRLNKLQDMLRLAKH